MNKLNIKYFLNKLNDDSVYSIAERIYDALGDNVAIDFNDENSGKNYINMKVNINPFFTKKEMELLSEPITHLISMNKFYTESTLIENDVNRKLGTNIECEFPTFDGDAYIIYQEAIAEVLISHLRS